MANLVCAKCNKPIEDNNLVECPFCWEMYHKECWEETKFCLSCESLNSLPIENAMNPRATSGMIS